METQPALEMTTQGMGALAPGAETSEDQARTVKVRVVVIDRETQVLEALVRTTRARMVGG